jgi:hypothetical protein
MEMGSGSRLDKILQLRNQLPIAQMEHFGQMEQIFLMELMGSV